MLTLDGSYGEGGGSLVRVALALSVFTGQSFEIKNIRSGRPQPGLKAQHLEAINGLKKICNAQTNDIHLGSTELRFVPGKIKQGTFSIDIGTAGSISLLLQAIVLPCLFAPGRITIKITGGTCGKWQASVDYLQNILLPHLQKFAEKIELKILKRGYYPKGGGEVQLSIMPKYTESYALTDKPEASFLEKLKEIPRIFLTEQGTLEQIRGIINVSADLEEKKVAERIQHTATNVLQRYKVPISLRQEHAKTLSIGGEALLWAVCSKDGDVSYINPILLGADVLLESQKKSEEIGKEVAEKLAKEIDSFCAVDPHLADMLIPFMALLPGSEIKTREVTDHSKTNIYVVEKFLPVKFAIEEKKIRVEGITDDK